MDTSVSPRVAILDASIAAVLPRLDLSSLAGQRLFITGGTGFFGLWLLSALRVLNGQGVEVQACVLSRNPIAFLSRHPQFNDQPWLKFITGNVTNFEIPVDRFDLLLHAATETSMEAHAAPINMFDNITNGTRRVLQLARSCGVRRVLLISSGAVYGLQPPLLLHQPEDSMTACSPLLSSSAYGEGKRVMELMGAILQKEGGVDVVVARCYAFCGPGLPIDGHFAMGNFIRDALFGNQITVKGDGSAIRSYLFGADLVAWLLYLLIKGKGGVAYNVGSDEPISIKRLAETVRDVLAPNIPITILNERVTSAGGEDRYVPSIAQAKALGCAPWTTLQESLILTRDFLLSQEKRHLN